MPVTFDRRGVHYLSKCKYKLVVDLWSGKVSKPKGGSCTKSTSMNLLSLCIAVITEPQATLRSGNVICDIDRWATRTLYELELQRTQYGTVL